MLWLHWRCLMRLLHIWTLVLLLLHRRSLMLLLLRGPLVLLLLHWGSLLLLLLRGPLALLLQRWLLALHVLRGSLIVRLYLRRHADVVVGCERLADGQIGRTAMVDVGKLSTVAAGNMLIL